MGKNKSGEERYKEIFVIIDIEYFPQLVIDIKPLI
jgi:hypothetical protein